MAKQKDKPTLRFTPLQKAQMSASALIAIRPGLQLGAAVDAFRQLHKLSRGEAVKRLTCLAVSRFDSELHYPLLAELAELLGGSGPFSNTCFQVCKILGDHELSMGKELSPFGITLIINGVLEATKNESEVEIDADTVVGAVTSKD